MLSALAVDEAVWHGDTLRPKGLRQRLGIVGEGRQSGHVDGAERCILQRVMGMNKRLPCVLHRHDAALLPVMDVEGMLAATVVVKTIHDCLFLRRVMPDGRDIAKRVPEKKKGAVI